MEKNSFVENELYMKKKSKKNAPNAELRPKKLLNYPQLSPNNQVALQRPGGKDSPLPGHPAPTVLTFL